MITRASQTLSRLTVGGNSTDPLWTPDGRRIAFTSIGDSARAPQNVYWQNSDGSGAREPLVSGPAVLWPMSWEPAGREGVEAPRPIAEHGAAAKRLSRRALDRVFVE